MRTRDPRPFRRYLESRLYEDLGSIIILREPRISCPTTIQKSPRKTQSNRLYKARQFLNLFVGFRDVFEQLLQNPNLLAMLLFSYFCSIISFQLLLELFVNSELTSNELQVTSYELLFIARVASYFLHTS